MLFFRIGVLVVATVVFSVGLGMGIAQGDPLRVHPTNPRYFTDGSGKAVYLTGSHTWTNLQDQDLKNPPAVFNYDDYLAFLKRHNHNFIRLWSVDRMVN